MCQPNVPVCILLLHLIREELCSAMLQLLSALAMKLQVMSSCMLKTLLVAALGHYLI